MTMCTHSAISRDDLEPNDAVIEASTLWVSAGVLTDGPAEHGQFENYLRTQEFAAFCEAVVLFERIILPGFDFASELVSTTELMTDLLRENILHFGDLLKGLETDAFDKLIRQDMESDSNQFKDNISGNVLIELIEWRKCALLFKEREFGDSLNENLAYRKIRTAIHEQFAAGTAASYFPGVLSLPFLASWTVPAGLMIYSQFSDQLRRHVAGIHELNHSMPISIPPVVAVLLERAGARKNVARELMALRDEFREFRTKYAELQRVIRNPDEHTLRELLEARRDCIADISAAIEKVTQDAGTNSGLMRESYEIACAGCTQIAIGNNITQVIQGVPGDVLCELSRGNTEIQCKSGRASILFDIWNKVLNIKGYARLYDRVLGFRLDNSVIDAIKYYGRRVEEQVKPQRRRNFLDQT